MTKVGERRTHLEVVASVLDLHAEGLSAGRIAVRLGITSARAQRLLAEGIASLPVQDVDELRATSELRLDRLAARLRRAAGRPRPRRATQSSDWTSECRARPLAAARHPGRSHLGTSTSKSHPTLTRGDPR